MASIKIIFAGGGTGGHLFPALAIADEIKRTDPDAEILFVGTKDKIESKVVPEAGYKLRTIWISGFHRSLRMSNLLLPLKMIVSFLQSYLIMRQFKPDVVVGTGGYVSGPVLRAAILCRIPTLIHEQNSYPGVTTRLLAPRVTEVHLTFEKTRKYLSDKSNTFISGNPTRTSLEAVDKIESLKYFGFSHADNSKIILVFGGSLGAHSINKAILSILPELMKKEIKLIWQTGYNDLEEIREITKSYSTEKIWVNAFIDRMDYAYSASDIVVCRAGATTIAEITRLGKASILIPYPHAAANHQVENASSLVEAGAAFMVYDNEMKEKLLPTIMKLINEEQIKIMSLKSKALGIPEAATKIAEHIKKLADKHGRK